MSFFTPLLCLAHTLAALTAGFLVGAILYQCGIPITRHLVLALWIGSFPIGWSAVRLLLKIPAWHQCYIELPANAGWLGCSRLRWQEMLISHIIIGALYYGLSSITAA